MAFTLLDEKPTTSQFTLIDEPTTKDDSSTLGNVLEQIPAGATEAFVEVGKTLKATGDYIRKKVPFIKDIDPGNQFSVPIPQFDQPKSAPAELVKGASQFLTAFLPFTRVVKGLGATGAVAKGMTAGALADITAFDPDDPKLVDIINDMAPALKNPITDFLTSQPDDTQAEKRLKRALEGLGLGALTEGVFRGVKALRAGKKAKQLKAPQPAPAIETPTTPAKEPPSIVGEDLPLTVGSAKTAQPLPPQPRLATTISGQPETLPKYAGSVNLERLQTEKGVKQAILEASQEVPKRQPTSMDDMMRMANEQGFQLDDVDQLAKTTTADRNSAFAARQVHLRTAELYEQARQTWVNAQTSANFEQLRTTEATFLRTFKAMQDIASNAGFNLRTFREVAQADMRTAVDKTLAKLMVTLQNKGKLSENLTKRMAALDKSNPVEVHTFLEEMSTRTASGLDKTFEAFLASILSGPQTHLANTLGNMGTLSLRPFERIASASADVFLRPFKPRDRFFGEAVADTIGMVRGLNSAVRAFGRTMDTGMTSFGTKFELSESGAKIGGKLGKAIRTPLRLLSATDEFFKILARDGDLGAQAYRLGIQRGLKGRELLGFTTDMALKPTEEMLRKAQVEATYRTFTKELGEAGKSVSHTIRQVPGLRYLAPFVRTPVNIAKFGLERTPLKTFDLIRMAAKGQLHKNGELSDDLGKLAIGLGVQAWVATQVISGNITGTGPQEPADVARLRQVGWQPSSIKIGDKYESLSRLEPFATMVGIMADATELVQAGREAEVIDDTVTKDLIDRMATMIVRNLSDKTFLQGLSSTSDVLHDPGRYGERWASQRARALVPNIIGQAARAQDPELRTINSMLDAIRSQLPRIGDFKGRQGLYPIRDYFGQPVEQPGNFWYRYLMPIRTSEINATPIEQRIADVGVSIAKLDRRITVNNQSIQLTDGEYDRYQEVAGQWAKFRVESLGSNIGHLTHEQQERLIRKGFAEGRDKGRQIMRLELLNTRPELRQLRR